MTAPTDRPVQSVVFSACPQCSYSDSDLVFVHHDCGVVVDCCRCGLRYTQSRNLSAMHDLRRSAPQPLPPVLLEKQADQTRDFEEVLDALLDLGAHGRLLDIGSITGHFLARARALGFDVVGIEPDPWAAAFARESFGVEVIEEVVTKADLPPASLGAVVMLHVMEHLTEPKQTLAEVHRLLAPEGVLGIEIPIIDALLTRVMGPHHRHYVFDHTLFMTQRTCTRFLEEAGFRVVRVQRVGRSLRLGRLARTLARNTPRAGDAAHGVLQTLRLDQRRVTINMRDNLRVFAVKEQPS